MFGRRSRAKARTAIFLVAAIATTSLVMMARPAFAVDDTCFSVADKGNHPGDDDFLTKVTVGRGTPSIVEQEIGFTGTTGIEALATRAGDDALYAADKNRLGTLDKVTAAFAPRPNTFGSGSGALGTKTFGNVDGLAFTRTGDRLFGTQRSEDDPDLLFEINITTGQRVKDAFGAGVDYLVVPQPGGRHNVDALATRDDQSVWAIVNKRGGSDSVFATIDLSTAAVTIINSTLPDPEGLGSSPNGLYAVTGKDFNGNQSFVWEMSNTGNMTNPKAIGGTPPVRIDFEGIECEQGLVPGAGALKFHDRNANGVRDLGAQPEPLLAGWVFHLIGAGGEHLHVTTIGDETNAIADLEFAQDENGNTVPVPPGQYLICESQMPGWTQTAPPAGADCSGHTHGGTVTPGPRGFDVALPTNVPIEFGNTSCVAPPRTSSNARAFGIQADLLGGGLLAADPDIGPTPDSDVMNPDSLLAVANILDPTKPPLVTLLGVSEQEDATSATATATTGAVDIAIPGLDALRVQADAIQSRSRSYAEVGGASSSSAGTTIANLRIGGVQYGDVSEPLSVVIDDPLSPGTPFIEVHVIERIRRNAAAGIPQPQGGAYRSGLDVNAIHIVVHDLALTTFLDESTDIIVAHASTDIAFNVNNKCPSVSGGAFAAALFNVNPDLIDAVAGRVLLPSTGGAESKALADVDVGTILTADAALTSTEGAISSLSPDAAAADSKAVITDANIAGLITAKLVEATASASCDSPVNALQSCSNSSISGDTVIADVNILGIDVCAALLLANTCKPAPNTELLHIPGIIRVVLNEQVPDADGRGITVNAIHIWVLDALPNPLLPIGAEVIISSAHADTHPRLP